MGKTMYKSWMFNFGRQTRQWGKQRWRITFVTWNVRGKWGCLKPVCECFLNDFKSLRRHFCAIEMENEQVMSHECPPRSY